MKDKKKLLLIIGIVLVLILSGTMYFVFSGTNENKDDSSKKENIEDKVVAPADNTEDLVKKLEVIEVEDVTEDEIVFSSNIDLKEKEKVAVWVYSKPKFLGYFEVLVENGTKKIGGLKEALEKITIEDGDHNIALTTEDGNPLGYIDVLIENNGTLAESKTENEDVTNNVEEDKTTEKEDEKETTTEKEEVKEEKETTTTKKVTEKETIKYATTKQKEANMKKGTTEVVQKGSNGTKEITYEVVYNADGKELSRKKVTEKVTKKAVNEIIKVGTSDFNINTDTTRGWMSGVACPESKTYTAEYDGAFHCNDETYTDLEQFGATIMAGKIIVTSIGGTKLSTAIIATPVNDYVFVGTYNGQKYYFDNRMGDGEPGTLTLDFCSEYNLSCGAW